MGIFDRRRFIEIACPCLPSRSSATSSENQTSAGSYTEEVYILRISGLVFMITFRINVTVVRSLAPLDSEYLSKSIFARRSATRWSARFSRTSNLRLYFSLMPIWTLETCPPRALAFSYVGVYDYVTCFTVRALVAVRGIFPLFRELFSMISVIGTSWSLT